jgi:hypothetical protein
LSGPWVAHSLTGVVWVISDACPGQVAAIQATLAGAPCRIRPGAAGSRAWTGCWRPGWRLGAKLRAIHDSAKVVMDLAIAMQLGSDCLADIGLLRAEPGLFGLMALGSSGLAHR